MIFSQCFAVVASLFWYLLIVQKSEMEHLRRELQMKDFDLVKVLMTSCWRHDAHVCYTLFLHDCSVLLFADFHLCVFRWRFCRVLCVYCIHVLHVYMQIIQAVSAWAHCSIAPCMLCSMFSVCMRVCFWFAKVGVYCVCACSCIFCLNALNFKMQ